MAPQEISVGRWDPADGEQVRALSVLLADYHRQTELEKGAAVESVGALPERYRLEILDPGSAFADAVVLLAREAERAVGCVAIADAGDHGLEIKRLWADPESRGRGVASALVDAVCAHAASVRAETIRLSVWRWRADAIGLYRKLGFSEAPSWEARDGLVCMTRSV